MGYLVAKTVGEACAALDAGAELIAGGTDWFPAKGEHVGAVVLVDVSPLAQVSGVRLEEGGWRIGAAVTWSELVRAELPPAFDALVAAARMVGSVQIQNVGTIVGNICNASPAADGVPPLLALGASVECISARGVRVLPLDAFLLGPRLTALEKGEFVSGLLIPAPPDGAVSAFHKCGSRRFLVISIAMVAVQVCVADGRLRDVRIAVGACGPVAVRLSSLEARLDGVSEVPHIGADDLGELTPIDDVRGSARHRLDIVATVLTRVLRGIM